ncbi:LacI family transcriptional regulator, partial [Kribbella antibiotica]
MPSSPVTRNDVARYAGVSTAVVSYVVNDGPRAVSPGARERVLEAIRVLGYRPNATARALRTGSTRTFGLITPDGGNPLFAELAKAIDKAAAARGYVVLQTSADGDAETERVKVAQLLARQVSGLVLVTPAEAPDLAGADVPVVVVNRVLPGVSSVSPRYREGAREAVEHLVGHGHTHIALVIGEVARGGVSERE